MIITLTEKEEELYKKACELDELCRPDQKQYYTPLGAPEMWREFSNRFFHKLVESRGYQWEGPIIDAFDDEKDGKTKFLCDNSHLMPAYPKPKSTFTWVCNECGTITTWEKIDGEG